MSPELVTLIVGLTSAVSTSGFWAYFTTRDKKRSATHRLLMAMAYNRIVVLGMAHIEQGWISKDEYEELRNYFYEPYKVLGGNGMADRIMANVEELPFRQPARYAATRTHGTTNGEDR